MRSHRVIALAALGLIAIAGIATTSVPAQPKKTISIAFVPPVLANPSIQAMDKALKLKAKSLGMKVTTVGGEFDPQAQIVAVDSVVQRKFDALLIWPIDPKGIQPSFDKARKAKIPIVLIDSPLAGPFLANFSPQTYAAAYAIGTYGAQQAKSKFGSCAVGIIQGLPVAPVLASRNLGLEAAAKKQGCEILDRQVNQKDNPDGARPIVDGWKTKFGSKMNLILTYNDPSALGAVSAVTSDFAPLITGMNADALGVPAVKSHALLATIATPPYVEVGEGMAQVVYDSVVLHKKVPKHIKARFELVTWNNVDNYKTADQRIAQGPMKVTFVRTGPLTATLKASPAVK